MSDNPTKDLEDGVKAGLGGASTGAAVGAAVGAVVPPPFNAVAAPFGAMLGAAIGFFISLSKAQAAEAAAIEARKEKFRAENHAANVEAAKSMSFLSRVGDRLAKEVIKNGWRPQYIGAYLGQLNLFAEQHPGYRPIINNFETALRNTALHKSAANEKSFKQMKALVDALGSAPDVNEDPFAFLRPPLVNFIGPGLAAAGINVGDPKVTKMMRDNYDGAQEEQAKPLIKIGIPIQRRSVGLASGGKKFVDPRAFNMKIAPYGVSADGYPLRAPWPYGLDADRFALPKSAAATASKGITIKHVGVAAGAGALAYYLLFL